MKSLSKFLFLKSELNKDVMRHIRLRLITENDFDFILQLRINTQLNSFFSQEDNARYYELKWIQKYKIKENNLEEFYFIIESIEEQQYGTARINNFINQSFSWGAWIINKNSPYYVAIESALLIYYFAFEKLNFTTSHFDVRKDNLKVINFHKRMGARITDYNHHYYQFLMTKGAYCELKNKYSKYFNL